MKDQEIQLLYDAPTIQQKVTALGRRLESEHGSEDPLLISIVGGSVVFLADLIRAIQHPIRFEFIQVQYGASDMGQIREIQFPISVSLKDQTLVIIKDVVTTGVVENYLSTQFRDRGARRVLFASLIDLPEERRSSFAADYRLFTPKRSGTFVGYGLKYRSRYGNLGYIGRLAEG